ncbi:MAG: hypothetical protein K5910_07780 [Bacteroidales bacterium]|nr:hypothetical protein [Bacteroidales bacterium]
MLSFISSARAGMPDSWFFNHFRIGMEWGYSQCLLLDRSYNIISQEGYRIFEDYTRLDLKPNGVVMVQVGVDVLPKLNLALYSGYIGVGENNRLIPLLLRASFFPRTTWERGTFFFAQGGPAWHPLIRNDSLNMMAGGGAGWRVPLSEDCNLDLLLSVKYLWDHPRIPNPEGPGYVPAHNIRRNDAGYCALDLTLAVNF